MTGLSLSYDNEANKSRNSYPWTKTANACLGVEYTQTIPTPPDSLGISSRQSQPLPVEKDNNYNKGTPDGSSGNLGKEEHTASGSVLATTSPSDTAEMGGAYSRITRRSPELQRRDTSSLSSSTSPPQQQQQRQMMQQNSRRQPVVVPPHAPAPITNYSVPLRAPVAVASKASPLVNANPNHVIRQPTTYAPVEVEPGFPTPSPPPSIPLPPASPASSPPSPPPHQPLQPAFGFTPPPSSDSYPSFTSLSSSSSSPSKSPSMRSINMSMAARGKPLIFAAMANVDDGPQMHQRSQERRVNSVASPRVQGRTLPPGAAHPSPPVEFASPRKEPATLSNAETTLKNRPISGMSSSPPKTSGPRAIPPSKARTPSPPAVNSTPQSAHSPRMHGPRQLPPSSPPKNPRVRKQSKARGGAGGADINDNGTSEGAGPSSTSSVSIPPPFNEPPRLPPKSATSSAVDPSAHVDEETVRKAGLPLDDDPFAKTEGVKMLPPSSPPPSRDGHATPSKKVRKMDGSFDDSRSVITHESRPSTANREPAPSFEAETHPGERKEAREATKEVNGSKTAASSSPGSPDDTRSTRKLRVKAEKLAAAASVTRPQSDLPFPMDKPEDRSPSRMGQFSLTQFLADPHLLSTLLSFLSFYEWLVLSSASREIRIQLVQDSPLREEVLERYLRTVGYARWVWDEAEPISLSLQDLADYMRGVSTPTHEYARIAAMYVQSLTVHPNLRDPEVNEIVLSYTAATRAYTRVVLRLRAQGEREQAALHQRGNTTPTGRATSLVRNGYTSPSRMGASRASSRAPSPTHSSFSHGNHQMSPGGVQLTQSQARAFQSPLFRYRRAPLLRVFVPSPEGDWLSDKSVLECEAECKRAGVQHLLRMGDVVWDVAVSDEGNVGRLVWDGSYLIDLDYTYSRTGDLPKYLPALAFPPSYFHRVIRTGAIASNPIVHIDISPWGGEVAANLQLLQDRVKTETPQGAIHNVVRWVHRSTFFIRPPPPRPRLPPPRIQIPDSDMFVDSGWYGTIVVESEGTNEALADLQDRCGPGAFPPRVRPVAARHGPAQVEARKVWRIMREKR
ncbi:hypothetical protein BDQ17DRAFT_1332458 [Cyathus striatus]|nr:hypothetical protein BDQ17DRAFT_1332458 [Cyathus striatus]